MTYSCSHTDLDFNLKLVDWSCKKRFCKIREAHKNEINDAASEATPHTMTVALVRLDPVPPPEDFPGIVKKLPRGEGSTFQWPYLVRDIVKAVI